MQAPVARNLKRALAENGRMTQEALAREVDVSVRTVNGWCQGTALPRWDRLVVVARVLNRPPGWFYDQHEEAAA